MAAPPMPTDPLSAWAIWGVIALAGVVAGLGWRYDAAKSAEISYLKAMLNSALEENRKLSASVARLSDIIERRR